MDNLTFICCILLVRAVATAAQNCDGVADVSPATTKGTEFCGTRFGFDCLGNKEQMQLETQPVFNNRNAGCHFLETEAECIASKDGRPEFNDSLCHWCCGTRCTTDNKTSLCEPWDKLREDRNYIGMGRNSFGENTCPEAEFYRTRGGEYCPCGHDLTTESQCRKAQPTFGPTNPAWGETGFGHSWRDCSYHKLCLYTDDSRNAVYFNQCPPSMAVEEPPYDNIMSICQAPGVPWPDVHVKNTSKPAWTDLDKDGDLDLAVGSRYGELQYYERMGDGSLLLREGDQNPFSGIDFGPGVAPAFVDWDEDTDPDLVVGNEDGKLQYYENTGDNIFVPHSGDRNPFRGIDVGSHAAPTLVDWDRNGDMDLIIGNQEGKIYWYERNNQSLLQKTGSENSFKDIDVGFSAAPTFADWDKDSDLDLIVGNAKGELVYYEWFLGMWLSRTGEQNPFNGVGVGSLAAPTVLHKDGQVFVAIGNEFGGLPHYRRTKVNHLNERLGISNPFFGVPVGSDAAPAPVDWDNDGDLDLIIGKDDGRLMYLERVDANNLLLRDDSENPFRDIDVGQTSRPAAVDWNSDGYIDLIVGNEDGELIYYEQLANNVLVMRQDDANPFRGIRVGAKAALAFVDWNNDGVWHLVIGCESGELQFYRREGDALSRLEGDANPFKSITTKTQSAPAFVDWDLDGDMDLVVGGSDGTLDEYVHDGDSIFPRVRDVSPFRFIRFKAASKPAFVDWDNDGDMDLIVGGVSGGEGRDGIAYQMNGCPQVSECSRRGNCLYSGECLCLDGYRGRGDCGICDAGFFAESSQPTVLDCERCRPGKYSASPGDDCSTCAAGSYSPSGSRMCSLCGVGRFSHAGEADCIGCSPGRFAHHQGSTICDLCEPGRVQQENSGTDCGNCGVGTYASMAGTSRCSQCDGDMYAEAGSEKCDECSLFYKASSDRSTCVADLPLIIICLSFMGIVFWSVDNIIFYTRRRIEIVDVSHSDAGVTITTSGQGHQLLNTRCPSYPRLDPYILGGVRATFFDTQNPFLEGSEPRYRVLPLDKYRLQLLTLEGKPVEDSIETSHGTLMLPIAAEFLLVGAYTPLVVKIIFLALPVSFIFIAAVEWEVALLTFVVPAVFGIIAQTNKRYISIRRRSPLQHRHDEYRQKLNLVNPTPRSCAPGPGRAVRFEQLSNLLHYFHDYLKGRNAYYLDSNILRPITKQSQLSFAELAGPNPVTYFVSHFWGTPFHQFVRCLQLHAMSKSWRDFAKIAYWICFCSNNQWRLHEEVCDWMASSFYKALWSETCCGTCLVLDEFATPLTRIWCLFEIIQTFKLETSKTKRPQYGGLAFCTSRGVLGAKHSESEETPFDVALALGRQLSQLDVAQATATVKSDEDMIRELMREEGGPEAMNQFIRDHAVRNLDIEAEQFIAQHQVLKSELSGKFEQGDADEPPCVVSVSEKIVAL